MAHFQQATPRRGFLNLLTAGATALGLGTVLAPAHAAGNSFSGTRRAPVPKGEADLWFNQIKGSHRVVYDVPAPHMIFPFAWPKVFLLSNQSTGSPEDDCGVVVVLRHSAICYAMTDAVWEKYNFAEVFGAKEHGPAFRATDAAEAARHRNPFWNTQEGDFKLPGIGAVQIGIRDLQASGVLFCVCDAAITVNSSGYAAKNGLDPAAVRNEWVDHLIPGIQVVPSGVWALGRAQEHGCAYIFAG